jgi:predicted phosphodiesterase
MPKTIVIGDVHGCYAELMDLLDRVGPSRTDKIYFAGDLIVKGPENQEVLDFLMENPRMQSVIGNHEYALLQDYRNQPVALKKSQKRTKKELGSKFPIYMEFISRWPLMLQLDKESFLVHAGVRPDLPLHQQTAEDLTGIRTVNGTPWFDLYSGPKTAVFGHWISEEPVIAPHAIGLDTGCVYGGRLTAMIWPERRFVSVKAREDHSEREKRAA